MSILLNLETSQISYTAAYVYALVDCLVYVEAPVGFQNQVVDINCIQNLNKSLYGLFQSP